MTEVSSPCTHAMPFPLQHHPEQEPLVEAIHTLEVDQRADIGRSAWRNSLSHWCKPCSHTEHNFARLYSALFHLPSLCLHLVAQDERAQHHDTHQSPTSHNDTHKIDPP